MYLLHAFASSPARSEGTAVFGRRLRRAAGRQRRDCRV